MRRGEQQAARQGAQPPSLSESDDNDSNNDVDIAAMQAENHAMRQQIAQLQQAQQPVVLPQQVPFQQAPNQPPQQPAQLHQPLPPLPQQIPIPMQPPPPLGQVPVQHIFATTPAKAVNGPVDYTTNQGIKIYAASTAPLSKCCDLT